MSLTVSNLVACGPALALCSATTSQSVLEASQSPTRRVLGRLAVAVPVRARPKFPKWSWLFESATHRLDNAATERLQARLRRKLFGHSIAMVRQVAVIISCALKKTEKEQHQQIDDRSHDSSAQNKLSSAGTLTSLVSW